MHKFGVCSLGNRPEYKRTVYLGGVILQAVRVVPCLCLDINVQGGLNFAYPQAQIHHPQYFIHGLYCALASALFNVLQGAG